MASVMPLNISAAIPIRSRSPTAESPLGQIYRSLSPQGDAGLANRNPKSRWDIWNSFAVFWCTYFCQDFRRSAITGSWITAIKAKTWIWSFPSRETRNSDPVIQVWGSPNFPRQSGIPISDSVLYVADVAWSWQEKPMLVLPKDRIPHSITLLKASQRKVRKTLKIFPARTGISKVWQRHFRKNQMLACCILWLQYPYLENISAGYMRENRG